MSDPAGARAAGLLAGHPGPVFIAHAGGNTADSRRQAIADGADFLEVDLFVYRGRFEARHERRLSWLPLLFEQWYLKWSPRHPFNLADLLRMSAGRARMFLDLKNDGGAAARLIREAMEAVPGSTLVASSQHWPILRAVDRACPGVDLYYSIDVQAQLDLMLSVAARDPRPAGVSCNQRLLAPSVISRLHDAGLRVVAWTVDDLDRAKALISWGVDGITTHRVKEMQALLGERP